MSEINDGGPAFPSANDIVIGDIGTSGHAGMTLRDYFASKRPMANDFAVDWAEALVGKEQPQAHNFDTDREYCIASIAWWAEAEAAYSYLQADAMLRARSQS